MVKAMGREGKYLWAMYVCDVDQRSDKCFFGRYLSRMLAYLLELFFHRGAGVIFFPLPLSDVFRLCNTVPSV